MSHLNIAFIDPATPITSYEIFKMVLLAPIAILRVFFILIVCNTFFAILPYLSHKVAQRGVAIFSALSLAAAGVYYIPVKGIEHLRNAKPLPIIVLNHISLLDGFLITRFVMVSTITTIANKNNWFQGGYYRYSKTLFISPKDNITDKICQRVNDPNTVFPLAVAPEGTVSTGKVLLKFKTGAFVPLKPVLPVLLRYPNKYMNPSFTSKTFALSTYRLLTQFVTYANVEFLPLVHPLPNETPKAFADRTRAIMGAALNVPLANLDLDSKRAFVNAL